MKLVGDHRPRGIDISQYNVVPLHGLDFVFIRASSADGGLHEDSAYARHVEEARHAGVAFGSYHFAANGTPAEEQARFFHTVVGKHRKPADRRSLGNVIDCEGSLAEQTAAGVITHARAIFRHDHDPRIGIYSGGWIKSKGGGMLGADFGWLAYWNGGDRGTIALPAHWSGRFARFWQYEVSGSPRIDRDLFRGTRAGLKRWEEGKG